jgi:hypothetical protein
MNAGAEFAGADASAPHPLKGCECGWVEVGALGGVRQCLDAEEFVWERAVLGVVLWGQVSGEKTHAKGEKSI